MSRHMAFRRQPMPQQFQQAYKTITIPAPTRGLVHSENEAFMQPGASIVSDNWLPTMRSLKLRGGTIRHCDLHALDEPVPAIPPIGAPLNPLRQPVISAFEYVSGNNERMFAAQETKLFDVTAGTPVLVKDGQTSGNYVASQLANLAGYWMLVCNETGDPVLRYDGTTWTTLTTELTGGPLPGTSERLSYVTKYRNRYFFIETRSMNMWYLPIDSHQGPLTKIPLSGAATKGGYLLSLINWSIDAGDGIDNKLVALTSEGEALVFTGSNPADPNNWRQEGRYQLSHPLGMNAHVQVGGDILIATVDGIIPISAAITKEGYQLELAAITRAIKPLWREDVYAKRAESWTMKKWDEFGGLFVAAPGGLPGKTHSWGANNATTAWCRITWDARCFLHLRGDMFFGDHRGLIMQCERTGMDDGNAPNPIDRKAYLATLVGGWEMFTARSQQVVWHQARAVFTAEQGEPFQPQLSACIDFVVDIPPPPPPGDDPGLLEVWDQGLWDEARWDQPGASRPVHRNTLWQSIGMTGFSHAPVVQVTVAQRAAPNVELIAIAATFEQVGVNV